VDKLEFYRAQCAEEGQCERCGGASGALLCAGQGLAGAEYLRVAPEEKKWMKTNRVEALSDGIFAIAMTLLVLGLTVPDATDPSSDALRQLLADDWPKFLSFAKSFLLLAVFWVIHHKSFHSIIRVDENFVWINFLALMFVVLIPFSTSLEGRFPDNQLATVIFHTNMLVVGIIYYFLWFYATDKYRLVDENEYDKSRIHVSRQRAMVMPLVAAIAIGLTFISPSWSSIAYALIPLILAGIERRAASHSQSAA
jgi:uncharacterized membrane protein